MNPIDLVWLGFVIGLSGALIPGPMLVYISTSSLRNGAKVGPLAVGGHLSAEAIYLFLFALGFHAILKSESLQTGMFLLGGGMLIFLGAQTIRARRESLEGANILPFNPFVSGVLLSSVLNPSVPIWWVGVGFSNLLLAYNLGSVLGIFYWLLGHVLSDITWFCSVSFLCARGRNFLTTRLYRSLLVLCGVFFIGWGGFLILQAFAG